MMLPSNRRERNNSLSPVMPGRRSGDSLSMRLQGSQTRVNSRICGRKVGTSRDDFPLPRIGAVRIACADRNPADAHVIVKDVPAFLAGV